MARHTFHPTLAPYRPFLLKWLPEVEIRPAPTPDADALVIAKTATAPLEYLAEEKRHLRHQDVRVIVDQLIRLGKTLPGKHADRRLLILAPHVRAEQAEILQRAGVDYVDLAGNAHLQAPGLHVHVEGRRPTKESEPPIRRPQRAWVKAVMAMLLRPELVGGPYRHLADEANVALGTVPACINDLIARGLLVDGPQGRQIVDRATLVALWTNAYVEALRPKLKTTRLQMRVANKDEMYKRLADMFTTHGGPWALTGADAAYMHDRFFRAEDTEIYADPKVFEARDIQRELVAQPATAGNLLVIEPPGPLALAVPIADKTRIAPPLLVYAELKYRGTQQAAEAADLLLPKVVPDAND